RYSDADLLVVGRAAPVRCGCDLDNRSGCPIVARKWRNLHVVDDALLKTRIEMAHRALIEVNDTTGRERSHIVYLDDDFLPLGFDERKFRALAEFHPTKQVAQIGLDGGRPRKGIIAFPGGCFRPALTPSGLERIVR